MELIGEGGCHSVTVSTTNPIWTDMVVTLVIGTEKPATDVYPICKSAQTYRESRRLCERW